MLSVSKFIITFLIFILFNLLNVCKSQVTLNPAEVTCMDNLRTSIGQPKFPDYCSVDGYSCIYDTTSSTYKLRKITLYNLDSTNSLTADVFSCYGILEIIDLTQYRLFSNFLSGSSSWNTYKKSIILRNCTTFSYEVSLHSTINSLTIELGEPANGNVFLSYMPNLNSLVMIDSKFPTSNIKFTNDLISGVPRNFSTFKIITNLVPAMINLNVNDLEINYYASEFDQQSIDNIKQTFNLVKNNIFINAPYQTTPLDFPFLNINSLYFRSKLKFNTPTSLIDLSQWKSQSIVIEGTSNFNLNNNIPFSKLPPTTTFSFPGGGISEWPDFSTLLNNTIKLQLISLVSNNIKQVKPWKKLNGIVDKLLINNNGMIGTIDSSFCELKLDVFNNNLDGSIPSCFTCYFGKDQTLMNGFSNNYFNNYNKSLSCDTIIPNLYYETGIQRLWLFGNDLGFTTNILAIPNSIPWKLSINSLKFYADIPFSSLPDKLNLTFPNSNDNGRVYTVAVQQQVPIINSISPYFRGSSLNQIEILGENFSYNTSTIKVIFNNVDECIVNESTFYRILCTLPAGNTITSTMSQKTTLLVTVNNNSTQSLGACINLCGLSSTCKVNQGTDNVGICECNSQTSCNGNGVCDTNNANCLCSNGYGGSGCFYKLHYVSGVESVSVSGGPITLYGSFSDIHIGLQILIGPKECSFIIISSNFIKCNIGSGSGINSITVIQNGIKWYDETMFHYLDDPTIPLTCPNDCTSSSNGQCNTVTGTCNCNKGWSGYNCASKDTTSTNTTIDVLTGTTKFNSDLINFDISLLQLQEIDFRNEIVESFSLENNWFVNITTQDGGQVDDQSKFNKIYLFNQTLQQNQSNIIYKLEEIPNDKEFEFANVQFNLKSGSIKTSVLIYNYKFKNSLNTLKLLLKSSAQVSINNNNNEDQACNDELKESEIENISNNQNLKYLSIKKGGKILSSRIINRILSDGIPTFITTSINTNETDPDQVLVSFNLPHCVELCIIDPDYAVLLSPDFKENCNDTKNNRKWVIPVAVVVSVVGASILVIIGFIIYKKHHVSFKVGVAKLKQLKK